MDVESAPDIPYVFHIIAVTYIVLYLEIIWIKKEFNQ